MCKLALYYVVYVQVEPNIKKIHPALGLQHDLSQALQ